MAPVAFPARCDQFFQWRAFINVSYFIQFKEILDHHSLVKENSDQIDHFNSVDDNQMEAMREAMHLRYETVEDFLYYRLNAT